MDAKRENVSGCELGCLLIEDSDQWLMSYGHGSESLCSMKIREFLIYLSDYKLFMKDSALWSYYC